MELEAMMIKAIKKFKKVNAKEEIRNICVAGVRGKYKNWKEATFYIEYAEEDGEKYKYTYITIEE